MDYSNQIIILLVFPGIHRYLLIVIYLFQYNKVYNYAQLSKQVYKLLNFMWFAFKFYVNIE